MGAVDGAVAVAFGAEVAVVRPVEFAEPLDADEHRPGQKQIRNGVVPEPVAHEAIVSCFVIEDGECVLSGSDEGDDDDVECGVPKVQ